VGKKNHLPFSIVDLPFFHLPADAEGGSSRTASNGKWKIYNGKWQMVFCVLLDSYIERHKQHRVAFLHSIQNRHVTERAPRVFR
jgi:hypothetical protein